MTNRWVVHDTRTPGFLTAVLLARSFPGTTATAQRGLTDRAADFWTKGVDWLLRTVPGGSQLALCGIPVWESTSAPAQIPRLVEHLGSPSNFEVYSHRWPDRYEALGHRSQLVPFDLFKWRAVPAYDRELLDLLLVASHQADPETVSVETLAVLDELGAELTQYYLRKAADDPDAMVAEFADATQGQAKLAEWSKKPRRKGTVLPRHVVVVQLAYTFDIPESADRHIESLIRDNLASVTSQDGAIGIGRQERTDGTFRIWLVRRRALDYERPSLWRLLKDDSQVPHVAWVRGDENTLQLVPERVAGWTLTADEALAVVQDWVKSIVRTQHGETLAPAIVAKALHEAGQAALLAIDVLQRYVPLDLEFQPAETIVRIDRGNRGGANTIRRTLVLSLHVRSAPAAAFLLRGDGFNLLKLEQQLQGVLFGLQKSSYPWLWSVRLAARVRIDARLDGVKLQELSPHLMRDVEPLELDAAVRNGVLADDSTIHRRISHAVRDRPDMGSLVLYRESELIGPSVHYAHACGALARALAESGQLEDAAHMRVLDLFSGSGFSALIVTQRCPAAQVYCIDQWIPQTVSLVATNPHVVWLRTSAEEVLGIGRRESVLEGRWDLVTMDPPHAALIGMIYQLLDAIASRTKWLVIYQGHTSQNGRTKALEPVLLAQFSHVGLLRIDSEEIIVAGSAENLSKRRTGLSQSFGDILEVAVKILRDEGWDANWREWFSPSGAHSGQPRSKPPAEKGP